MKKERVHWIDVAKGVLVVLMVLNHIPIIAKLNGIDNSILRLYHLPAQIYTCFFMQAFFILSGYTTNFNKDALTFIKGKAKGILLPWLTFSILCDFIPHYLKTGSAYLDIDGINYFVITESYWFLSALFLSQITYFLLKKFIANRWVILVCLAALMFTGFAINFSYTDFTSLEDPSHYKNYFHYRNYMCMAIFLWVGDNLRSLKSEVIDKITKYSMLCFLPIIAMYYICRIFHLDCQLFLKLGYSHGTGLTSYPQIPLYLVYTVAGSLCFFWIIRYYLNQSRIVEYMGANSIVLYCTHFIILKYVMNTLTHVLPPPHYNS